MDFNPVIKVCLLFTFIVRRVIANGVLKYELTGTIAHRLLAKHNAVSSQFFNLKRKKNETKQKNKQKKNNFILTT